MLQNHIELKGKFTVMIRSQELSIGNLVGDEWTEQLNNYKFIIVEDINDKGINLKITDDGNWSELAQYFITPEYDFSQLRGIPLSEEILLKVGFEKTAATFVYGSNLVIGLDLDWLAIFSERMQDDIEFDCPKYLHQLQNLYFALTLKELNVDKLI